MMKIIERVDLLVRVGFIALLIAMGVATTQTCRARRPDPETMGTARKPLVMIAGQTQQIPTADFVSSPGGASTNATPASGAGDFETTSINASGNACAMSGELVLHVSGAVNASDIVHTASSATASRSALGGRASGTYDTTAGALTAGNNFVANASRIAGANPVTNIAVTANASGGQVNYAFDSVTGIFLASSDTEFGGNVYAVGPSPPALTACGGGGPVAVGDNNDGFLTEGTAATGCVMTFTGGGYSGGGGVTCTLTSQDGLVFTYLPTASNVTITNVGALSGKVINYHCRGLHAGPLLMSADEIAIWTLVRAELLSIWWLVPDTSIRREPLWTLVREGKMTIEDALGIAPASDPTIAAELHHIQESIHDLRAR